ncbi:IS91 family transposase [Alkalihalobacterium alkalinitrilicum]|uniref:IS91 family transposase n=1 Tax=Alkalihalobacterium alkalinitrilicum TaxID=427920 RepID=UPI000995494D|nr:transposase [Alkalihalobacterium alkalinitrilicum]
MKKQGIVKQILKDHFDGFWKLHNNLFPEKLQKDIQETVEKAMRCGSSDTGYAKYECLGCEGNPDPVVVCFTGKSRFCHRCGKKYTDEWTEKQVECILDVPHRHMVFTVPKELRQVFFKDRKKLNELAKEVAQVFDFWYKKKNKKRQLEVGVITVIHTFGRDLKFNPHIHALVTEGAIDKEKEWVPIDFIPYNYLRKSWQKLLMDLMMKWFPNRADVKQLVDQLYIRYPHGFYVNAEKKMKNAKGAAKYIGRYLARPAIAEYRIEKYHYNSVHFWYEDHQTGKKIDKKVSVYRFIYELIQHIPPKHFRMVGRFGLYSRRKNTQSKKIINVWNFMRTKQIEFLFEQKRRKKTYRQRMMEAFETDPLQCPHCKGKMDLVGIWHSEYGWVYHYMDEIEMIKHWRRRRDEREKAG